MKRRKDTKFYANAVKTYCVARSMVENFNKQIEQCSAELKEAKEAFDKLSKEFINDDVKKWYNCYCELRRMTIGSAESLIGYHKNDFENYRMILKEDFDEDLDILYSLNKGKI